jgi:hypothetical protein
MRAAMAHRGAAGNPVGEAGLSHRQRMALQERGAHVVR